MIERIITFSIRNRFLVILAGFLLALWGIYAVYHTPMDAIPTDPVDPRREVDRWLGNYSEDHRNPINVLIHWICVPLILWTVIALLWIVPVPPLLGRARPVICSRRLGSHRVGRSAGSATRLLLGTTS